MANDTIQAGVEPAAGKSVVHARRLLAVMLIMLLMGGLSGCGTVANKGRRMTNSIGRLMPWSGKKKEKEAANKEAEMPERPQSPAKESVRSGKIVFVQRDQGFALVRSTYGSRLATGTEIKGHRPDGPEACTLRCSPERKPGFIVADIASGDPQEGQIAFVSQAAVRATEAGSVTVPGAGNGTMSTRPIPGLPPSSAGSTGVDTLPPLPDLPEVSIDELPDFPID